MTLDEIKELMKLSPEEEIEWQKNQKRNKRKRNLYDSLKKHSLGICFLSVVSVIFLPFYFGLTSFVIFFYLGYVFHSKHEFYEACVNVGNMTAEDHLEFFKQLEEEKENDNK